MGSGNNQTSGSNKASNEVSITEDQCYYFTPPAPAIEGAYSRREVDSAYEWYAPAATEGEPNSIVTDLSLIAWLNTASENTNTDGIVEAKILCPTVLVPTSEENPVQCYNMEVPVGEPTSKPNNAANKGYVKQRYWQVAQFENEGNTSNVDSGFHSIITTDEDGLPVYNGDIVESNVTTMTRSEAGANGELFVWEGYLYNPIRYPDTAAGKYVKKFELVETYTTVTYADYEQVYIASDSSGAYTLDRDDLKLVLDAPAAGSFPSFELDPSQRGQWARFFIAHGDKGVGSQCQWQARLTYADNSVQILAITNFLHQADVQPAYHAATEIVPHTYDTDSGEWQQGGSTVTVDTSLGNLQQVPCGELPITFTPYLSGDTFAISSPVGGAGSPYEYSIDAGRTWQTSNSFSLSGGSNREVIPMVKDANGTKSAKSGLTSYVPCVNSSWFADIAGGIPEQNFGDRYAGSFSYQIANQLEQSNTGLTWNKTNTTNDGSYLYLGNTSTENTASADASIVPILPASVLGQLYTVALDAYGYYFGFPYAKSTLTLEVVDTVTSNILTTFTKNYDSNQAINYTNEYVQFLGTGNPIEFKFNAEAHPMIPVNGFFGDIGNLHLDEITTDGYIKRTGSEWATDIASDKARSLADGVNVKFSATAFNQNCGMHGLNAAGSTNSYTDIDYAIYLTGGSVGIYENGASRGSFGTYLDADVFEVNITAAGQVDYLKNGVIFYTSLITATNNLYYYSGQPYVTNQGIKGYSFNGDKTIHSGDWFGNSAYWIEDGSSLVKTAASGWNVQCVSTTMRAKADGVLVEFTPNHSKGDGINDGMFGLSGDTPNTSYTGIDYAWYFEGNAAYVYEKGTNRGIKQNNYDDNDVFTVEIDAAGTVLYKRNGNTRYTSLVNANQDNYFCEFSSYAGQSNTLETLTGGVKDVNFNGNIEFEIPDAAGNYIRINSLRLFQGEYSDGTHYAKNISNYYLVRNLNGYQDTVTFDPHTHSASDDVMVIPQFRLVPYGTLQAQDSVELRYRINSGAWVTMLKEYSTFNVANEVDLDAFEFMQGVDVSAGDSIQYQLIFDMEDSTVNRGYYLYTASDFVKCS